MFCWGPRSCLPHSRCGVFSTSHQSWPFLWGLQVHGVVGKMVFTGDGCYDLGLASVHIPFGIRAVLFGSVPRPCVSRLLSIGSLRFVLKIPTGFATSWGLHVHGKGLLKAVIAPLTNSRIDLLFYSTARHPLQVPSTSESPTVYSAYPTQRRHSPTWRPGAGTTSHWYGSLALVSWRRPITWVSGLLILGAMK